MPAQVSQAKSRRPRECGNGKLRLWPACDQSSGLRCPAGTLYRQEKERLWSSRVVVSKLWNRRMTFEAASQALNRSRWQDDKARRGREACFLPSSSHGNLLPCPVLMCKRGVRHGQPLTQATGAASPNGDRQQRGGASYWAVRLPRRILAYHPCTVYLHLSSSSLAVQPNPKSWQSRKVHQ